MRLGTAAAESSGGGKVSISGQERNSEQGAKVFESLTQRFGRKVVDRGRKAKEEEEELGQKSVVGFTGSEWDEQHGHFRIGAAARSNPAQDFSRYKRGRDDKRRQRVDNVSRNEKRRHMDWSTSGKQWHPRRRLFRGQHVLNRDRYFRESCKYMAPKILDKGAERERSLNGKKKRPMSFCDLLWEEREVEKQRQRSGIDACWEDGSIQHTGEKDVLLQTVDKKIDIANLCQEVPELEIQECVGKGSGSQESPSRGKNIVLRDGGFAHILDEEVEGKSDAASLELDNGIDVIDLRDDSSTSPSPDVSSDMIEEISGISDLTETSEEERDHEQQQQQQTNNNEKAEEERVSSTRNRMASWASRSNKSCFLNRQAQYGDAPGSFPDRHTARGHAPSTRSAWFSAAMAWRQKNMPTESELRRRKDEASKRASQAARMRNQNGRFQEEIPESEPVALPIKIPSKPDADASESEWRLYFKNFHAARIASAKSFVQVLRAFNVSCKDPENLKGAYMQAVRMYHPDSNSKLRTWSTDREKAEAEEIMKLINQRKPHEFSI